MKEFKTLIENMITSKGVMRPDIRMDPNGPLEGPYLVILAHYDEPLSKEREDEIRIVSIKKDKHRFDDYDVIENIYKNRAQDPFDKSGRSLNGKSPIWQLPSTSCRYHITNERLVKEAMNKGVKIDALAPPLQFPKENKDDGI